MLPPAGGAGRNATGPSSAGRHSGCVPALVDPHRPPGSLDDDFRWTAVSAERPCPVCGARAGCGVAPGAGHALGLVVPSDRPLDVGGWLHALPAGRRRARRGGGQPRPGRPPARSLDRCGEASAGRARRPGDGRRAPPSRASHAAGDGPAGPAVPPIRRSPARRRTGHPRRDRPGGKGGRSKRWRRTRPIPIP